MTGSSFPACLKPIGACLAVLAGLTACSNVFESTALDEYTLSQTGKCRNPAGAYNLPKNVLAIQVEKTGGAGKPVRYEMSFRGENVGTDTEPNYAATRTIADRDHAYCLDFLGTGNIAVVREPEAPSLLKRVFTNIEEKAGDIAEKLVEGAAVIAANARVPNRQFATSDKLLVASFEFDPFDYEKITAVNAGLRSFGYCIYLDPRRDAYVPSWMEGQCGGRQKLVKSYSKSYSGLSILGTAPFVAAQPQEGIFYKPLLSHSLVIMRKRDPSSSFGWKVWRTRRVTMPNAAPPFLLQVNRSMFVTRKTDLHFKNGLLLEASISKPSEAEAVTDVLVKAVQVIIKIPATAIALGTNRANNQKALIDANQRLIATIRSYEEDVEAQQTKLSGLTADEFTKLQQQGGVPGLDLSAARGASTGLVELSYEICLQNVLLENPDEAEAICRDRFRSQQ